MNRKELMVGIEGSMREARYYLNTAKDYMEQLNAINAIDAKGRTEK